MELYIAGGCTEHGRNSFLLNGKGLSVLVDAGKMKEIPDKPFPELSSKQIRKIDYLFLTHCHADHTGAVLWLYEKGFQGKVVAARATLRDMAGDIRNAMILEDLGESGREIELTDKLHVMWGRSGHCVGSVWYRIRLGKKTVLFTGDYEEKSYAYRCDKIRGLHADLAVVDCAYGEEQEDAGAHREELEEALNRLTAKKRPLLFPVPSHGRGFDVIKLLADRGVPAVIAQSISREYQVAENREFWLKESFLSSVENLKKKDITIFEKKLADSGFKEFPRGYSASGILVRDSQLSKECNRRAAEAVCAKGGMIVLTGKQDPSSYSRKMLDAGAAEFHRISVHQNRAEFERLLKKNSFDVVIPYHCRDRLEFPEKNIHVMTAGESIRF